MAELECLKSHRSFDGWTRYYKHRSDATKTDMKFSVYLPPQVEQRPCPAVYFLSGLTCTEENFMSKSGVQRYAAEAGLVIIAPDTSPRSTDIPGEDDAWDFGSGAGFYVNATEAPWSKHYRMYEYIQEELPALIEAHFPVLSGRRGVMGHSMGGHGALVVALREPKRWLSVSAFAPIAAPSACAWGQKAFRGYLGADRSSWSEYDATLLIQCPAEIRRPILVDQGTADEFIQDQLMPEKLREACAAAHHPLDLQLHEGYDHSYYFIASFISKHVEHHAQALA